MKRVFTILEHPALTQPGISKFTMKSLILALHDVNRSFKSYDDLKKFVERHDLCRTTGAVVEKDDDGLVIKEDGDRYAVLKLIETDLISQ